MRIDLRGDGVQYAFSSNGFRVVDAQKQSVLECASPIGLLVKDYAAKQIELSAGYETTQATTDGVRCVGHIASEGGTVFRFEDAYSPLPDGSLLLERDVLVESDAGRDLGFVSRFSLALTQRASMRDVQCFAPGAWYRQNEHAPERFIGHDLSLPCYWYRETRYALPMFALWHPRARICVSLCRAKANMTMGEMYELTYDARTDATLTYGSIGPSVCDDRVSLDYLYPGLEGCNERMSPYYGSPYSYQFGYRKRYHPATRGFCQHYSLVIHGDFYTDFDDMMRSEWRRCYNRMRAPLARLDNHQAYEVSVELLRDLCGCYHGAWGAPFKCLLPTGEIGIVDYQMGFIGQQPNIGFQLLSYGLEHGDADARDKGERILDQWAGKPFPGSGLPATWVDVRPREAIGDIVWLRMLTDGLEGILDGYQCCLKHGRRHDTWLQYALDAADRLLALADSDGSWRRCYQRDGAPVSQSKANTCYPIRFLLRLSRATGKRQYADAARKAGLWCCENVVRGGRYIGGTCDNAEVLDKEAGIYAMFAFLALYDDDGDARWLNALQSAADYTETWTYCWSFPVRSIEAKHAFKHASISGQSLIATGHSAADVYMAACSYAYYRLYLITKDEHELDFAIFLSHNAKQATDWTGAYGYGRRGLCEESAELAMQDFRGVYAWLPWCSYVQMEPIHRLREVFGVYEIEDAQTLPQAELARCVGDLGYRVG